MIEESLVENARLIKRDFNLLNNKLLTYEEDVSNLSNFMIKVSEDIKNIGKNVSKKDTIFDLQKQVFEKLNELELESNRVSEKINLINIEMERLKDQEMKLFLVIKKRHPSLSDDDIKIEIQRRIID